MSEFPIDILKNVWLERANDPNRHIWPEIEDYIFAASCKRCHAPAGEECDAPRERARRRSWTERQLAALSIRPIFHAPRVDRGVAHSRKDIGNAPVEEEREPGRCYCTIVPCPIATEADRVAAAARWAKS